MESLGVALCKATQLCASKKPVKGECSICVCVWGGEMWLKLSACFSLSISSDRAINCSAAPTEHVLANCEPSGSPFRQSLLLLLSSDSPHFPSSFDALFSLLYHSWTNQSDSCRAACFASLNKPLILCAASPFVLIPALQCLTPSYPTVRNPSHISCLRQQLGSVRTT